MKLMTTLTCLVFLSVGFLQADDKNDLPVPTHSPERALCTTLTQGQYTRFDRCREGEIMTGIRSLDPLVVYCTRLLANCRSTQPSKDR